MFPDLQTFVSHCGSSSCKSCISSTSLVIENVVGASKIQDACQCVKGSSRIDSDPTCIWCEPGKYAVSKGSGCASCAPGYYNPTCGEDKCIACEPGKYAPIESSECTTCETSKYANEIASTGCKTCLSGHSCIDGIMKVCPRGTKQENLLCKPCDPGKYSKNEKSIACTDCPKGTYNDNIGSSDEGCIACPMGKFSDNIAAQQATDCLSCDSISKKMTTIGYGAETSLECSCEPGTYFHPLKPLDDRCAICPEGAECRADVKQSLYGLKTKPGFWRENIYSNNFIKCLDLKMCKGGTIIPKSVATKLDTFILSTGMPGNINETILYLYMKEENVSSSSFDNAADIQCAEGYKGVLCKSCAENYKFSMASILRGIGL